MSEIIETSKNGKYRVRLEIDQCPSNPRVDRDCNLVNVITPAGQRYIDADEDGGPLQDGWDRVAERDDAVEVFTRWARIFHGITVVEQRPHNGAWSLWYVTPEKLAETALSAAQIIEVEFGEYQAWADGDVYGFIIEKRVHWVSEDHGGAEMDTWEHVESCWGHIGREYAEEAAREAFDPYEGDAK